MFEFKSTYINPSSSVYYSGVVIPKDILEQIKKLENTRFIITVNEDISFPGAAVPVDGGTHIILINKARSKKLGLQFNDEVSVKMVSDESKYGMPLPDEFDEVLNEDPEGKELFESLTPGKIRNLIYLVSKLKSTDKRIEKSVIILEHLRANKGKLDFKMLNLAFKEYNKR